MKELQNKRSISVIIPAYNCESTLTDTIHCICCAGLGDYEIILIDDGSTDETPSLCDKLCDKYKEIRCIHQNNRGVSAARNRGLREAKGEYLWFVDADDTIEATELTKVQHIIGEYKPDMLIFGMSFDYYHKGRCYRREKLVCEKRGECTRLDIDECFEELYDANALTPIWNKIIRREIIQGKLHFAEDMILLEDFLFSLECIRLCNSFYLFPEIVYRYRQAEDEGNVYRRLARIGSLTEYVSGFEELLEEHPVVMSKLYYMLLFQKLWRADIAQAKIIADDHEKSHCRAYREMDIKLDADLKAGRLRKILLKNRMLQMRHGLANWVKQKKRGSII